MGDRLLGRWRIGMSLECTYMVVELQNMNWLEKYLPSQ
jgi:hypothetical protein